MEAAAAFTKIDSATRLRPSVSNKTFIYHLKEERFMQEHHITTPGPVLDGQGVITPGYSEKSICT